MNARLFANGADDSEEDDDELESSSMTGPGEEGGSSGFERWVKDV